MIQEKFKKSGQELQQCNDSFWAKTLQKKKLNGLGPIFQQITLLNIQYIVLFKQALSHLLRQQKMSSYVRANMKKYEKSNTRPL